METVMTRMVSGLKLNATIRVSKISNSRAPDLPGMLQGTQAFFLWSSGASVSSRTSQASGKVQLDALQIKFDRGNEKEVERGRVERYLGPRFSYLLFPHVGGEKA